MTYRLSIGLQWSLSGLVLSALMACQPVPIAPPPAAIPLCDESLASLPAVFSKKPASGLSALSIDTRALAQAECIDATATQQLASFQSRREVAALAVANRVASTTRRRQARPSLLATQTQQREFDAALDAVKRGSAALDATFDKVYESNAERSTRGIDETALIATALFDYSRLVREHLGTTLHTRVARLIGQKFCDGDIVQQRLLWRYFEAAVRSGGGDRDATADAVRALRSIAMQTACLGDRQLYDLDRAMTLASYDLQQRLLAVSDRTLESRIAAFIFQARLLIFDATKHYGTDSPSYRWWLTQEDLRRRIREGAVWPMEQVLWLYDRRTAAMVAIKTSCNDGGAGTKCLNLAVLSESLTRPAVFGLAECSVLEMIEGGIRNVAGAPSYTCTGGLCGTPNVEGRIPNTSLAGTFSANWTAAAGYRFPRATTLTPFGVSMPDARAALCGTAGGGFGSNNGNGGLGAAGMGVGGDKMACVVGVHAAQTAALVPGIACIARYVQATSPLQPPSETMNPTSYAGVPRGCAISDGGTADAGTATNPPDAGADEKKKAKEIQDAAKKLADDLKKDAKKLDELKKAIKEATKNAEHPDGIDATDAEINAALKDLQNASVDNGDLVVGGKAVYASTDTSGNITINLLGWLSSSASSNQDTLMHEFVHSVMMHAEPGRKDDWGYMKSVHDATDENIMKKWNLKGSKRCMQEDPSCSNACNGMSRQTQQALACLDSALNPQTVPPRPQDLVTDPIEPQGAGGAQLLTCFEDTPNIGGVIAVRQCGAVRCANTAHGASTSGCCLSGGALESTGMDSRRNSICPLVLCTAGGAGAGAVSGDASMCGCSGGYGAPAGGVPPAPPTEGHFPPSSVPPH